MHNFQTYLSKFSQGTSHLHAVNTGKCQFSEKKVRKKSTFFEKAHKKVRFLPKITRKSPLSSEKHPPKSRPGYGPGKSHGKIYGRGKVMENFKNHGKVNFYPISHSKYSHRCGSFQNCPVTYFL